MTNLKVQKVLHLAKELTKKKPNVNHLYMVTRKIDGIYIYIDFDVETGWGYIHSRANRIIPAFKFLQPTLGNRLAIPSTNMRLIAEAYIDNTPFHILAGVFNRSVGNFDATEVKFNVHDVVTEANVLPAIERFSAIPHVLTKGDDRFTRAELLHVSNSPDLWEKTFNEVVKDGYEGIVLKQANSIYSSGKRNSSLMKIKREVTADLLAIRLEETTGEKGEPNVNLVLLSKDNVEISVRVGNFEERESFLANPAIVIGRVVEIAAMEKLPNGTYREPVYKYIRDDKNAEEID